MQSVKSGESSGDVGGNVGGNVVGIRRPAVSLWAAIAVLIFAIAIAMGPIARSGFSYWDDEDTISQNPDLNPPTWAGLAERWTRPHMHIYSPLTHTAWQALALVSPKPEAGEIGHVVAWPFKLTNLCVHAMASVLVLLILRRLVGAGWPALIGALAFAVHPVQVEAVGWASGLKDLLFGMFSAGCLLAYIGTDVDRVKPRGARVAAALALLVLAGLSKPTAMVVPAMLLALDLLWLRRPLAQTLARLVPFGVVGIAFAIFARGAQPPILPELQAPLLARPIVAIDVISFYLGKLLVPIHLAYDYGSTSAVLIAAARATPVWFALKVVGVAAIGVVAIVFRRRWPLVLLGVLWAVMPLLPVLGFTYFDFSHYSTVADHYLYLPMVGIALLIAAALSNARHEPVCRAIFGVVVVGWIALSFHQSQTWHDARAVTEQTLRVNDRSFASWSNLALAELRTNDPKQLPSAETHARHALEFSPDDPQCLFVLANVLQEEHDEAGAIEMVRKALKLSPYSAPYRYRLAQLLGNAGQVDEAIKELEQAVMIDPKYPGAKAQLDQLRVFARQQRAATLPATMPRRGMP